MLQLLNPHPILGGFEGYGIAEGAGRAEIEGRAEQRSNQAGHAGSIQRLPRIHVY